MIPLGVARPPKKGALIFSDGSEKDPKELHCQELQLGELMMKILPLGSKHNCETSMTFGRVSGGLQRQGNLTWNSGLHLCATFLHFQRSPPLDPVPLMHILRKRPAKKGPGADAWAYSEMAD